MSKYFVILLMLTGTMVTACADDEGVPALSGVASDTTTSDVLDNTSDAVSDVAASDVVASDVEPEPSTDSVEPTGSEGESDAASEVPVETEEEQAGNEPEGDPTEDPGSDSAAYYEFAEWAIPANGQNEEDNR